MTAILASQFSLPSTIFNLYSEPCVGSASTTAQSPSPKRKPISFLEMMHSPEPVWLLEGDLSTQGAVESHHQVPQPAPVGADTGKGGATVARRPPLPSSHAPAQSQPQLALLPSKPLHNHQQVSLLRQSSSPSMSVTLSTVDSHQKRHASPDADVEASSSKKPRVQLEEVPDEEELRVRKDSEVDQLPTLEMVEVHDPSQVALSVPPPPRSPSPPRDHRPVVPSPLAPAEPTPNSLAFPTSSSCSSTFPPRPQPRRRSRSTEIALLKFALDPWLRLSRSLDGSSTKGSGAGGCGSFNPATFPSAGNLRELRSRSQPDPFYGGFDLNLNLPFDFGYDSSPAVDMASGIVFGDHFSASGSPRWNLVDA